MKSVGHYIGIHLNLSDPKWKEIVDEARKEYDIVTDVRIFVDNKIYDFTFDELIERITK